MLELTEEEIMIRDTARDFADRELAPKAGSIDRNAEVPREILKQLAEIGFLGILVVGFAYVWIKGDLEWLTSVGEVKTGRNLPKSPPPPASPDETPSA